MNYIELTVKLQPAKPFTEIFISALGEEGFESFVETDEGFQAYIQESDYTEDMEKSSWAWQLEGVAIQSHRKLIPRENWNKNWEDSFEPILVDDQVYIFAPFHQPKPEIPHQILIEPKMSFGTGHHATTNLMVQFILETHCSGKTILDMGCGTGILAILAMQRGALKSVAIDIDDWSIENTIENAQRNKVPLETRLGGAELLHDELFDIIFANINLNVLLADVEAYSNVLKPQGIIIFSGFYEEDLSVLQNTAKPLGLSLKSTKTKDKWMSAIFVKK